MGKERLIYVIGASGCGKDSVMAYARERCPAHEAAFAHRYITRPPGIGGENHVALTPEEFQARRDKGLFVLSWDSHGLSYGIGIEVDSWLKSGLSVVMNGSRAYLPEASRRYPNLVPVLIEVEMEILRHRLDARGREGQEDIRKRLDRALVHVDVVHPRLVRIDNSGKLGKAGAALLEILLGE